MGTNLEISYDGDHLVQLNRLHNYLVDDSNLELLNLKDEVVTDTTKTIQDYFIQLVKYISYSPKTKEELNEIICDIEDNFPEFCNELIVESKQELLMEMLKGNSKLKLKRS